MIKQMFRSKKKNWKESDATPAEVGDRELIEFLLIIFYLWLVYL